MINKKKFQDQGIKFLLHKLMNSKIKLSITQKNAKILSYFIHELRLRMYQ